MDPPQQTLKSTCKKGSGPAKVKMDNQRNTQSTSSIPVKHGTPNPSRVNVPNILSTWHVSIASRRRHTQSRRTPRHPCERQEPQLSLMTIRTPRQPAGTLPLGDTRRWPGPRWKTPRQEVTGHPSEDTASGGHLWLDSMEYNLL